jgi:acetolactate decarboxylase
VIGVLDKLSSRLVSLLILIICVGYGCPRIGEKNIHKDIDIIFQTSTITALSGGVFEGDLSVGELKKMGDFGLGTFNGLDGEMIELDGKVYQIRDDGVAYPVKNSMKTPFSAVTFFDTDRRINVRGPLDCGKLENVIDKFLPTKNIFYAIKVSGLFENVKARSISEQHQPFPSLAQALKGETTFELHSVKGTLVGFRFPSYVNGLNVPGYHFHFLTDDRKAGGHVLECNAQDVKVDVDYSSQLNIKLPDTQEFYEFVQ